MRYIVQAVKTIPVYIEVNAESKEEAEKMAKTLNNWTEVQHYGISDVSAKNCDDVAAYDNINVPKIIAEDVFAMKDLSEMTEDEFLREYPKFNKEIYQEMISQIKDYLTNKQGMDTAGMTTSYLAEMYILTKYNGLCPFDADRYFWICTLFGYDIGYHAFSLLNNWLYENGQDIMDLDFLDLDTVRNICLFELNLDLVFDSWGVRSEITSDWVGKTSKDVKAPAYTKTTAQKYDVLVTIGQYTLINRHTNFEPYVVAFMYDDKSGTWAQGLYYGSAEVAIANLLAKGSPSTLIEAASGICASNEREDIAEMLTGMKEGEQAC